MIVLLLQYVERSNELPITGEQLCRILRYVIKELCPFVLILTVERISTQPISDTRPVTSLCVGIALADGHFLENVMYSMNLQAF